MRAEVKGQERVRSRQAHLQHVAFPEAELSVAGGREVVLPQSLHRERAGRRGSADDSQTEAHRLNPEGPIGDLAPDEPGCTHGRRSAAAEDNGSRVRPGRGGSASCFTCRPANRRQRSHVARRSPDPAQLTIKTQINVSKSPRSRWELFTCPELLPTRVLAF